jgi:hypothetical protein
MRCVETVTVVCDRCHRPGWRLEISELTGEVRIDGARIDGADGSRYWDGVLRGRRAHRYRAAGAVRPGAWIQPADAPGTIKGREQLICAGSRHPRYQRVVTLESATRAYWAAVAAGRASIGLREIG